MALTKPIDNPFDNTELESAYLRVAQMNLDFTGQTGLIVVNAYASAEAREANKPPVAQYHYTIPTEYNDPPGSTPGPRIPSYQQLVNLQLGGSTLPSDKLYDIIRTRLYNILKQLPEFADAVDVL